MLDAPLDDLVTKSDLVSLVIFARAYDSFGHKAQEKKMDLGLSLLCLEEQSKGR